MVSFLGFVYHGNLFRCNHFSAHRLLRRPLLFCRGHGSSSLHLVVCHCLSSSLPRPISASTIGSLKLLTAFPLAPLAHTLSVNLTLSQLLSQAGIHMQTNRTALRLPETDIRQPQCKLQGTTETRTEATAAPHRPGPPSLSPPGADWMDTPAQRSLERSARGGGGADRCRRGRGW